MNQEVSITKEQVQKEMKYFRRLFPIVRLLDGERLLHGSRTGGDRCTRNLPLL